MYSYVDCTRSSEHRRRYFLRQVGFVVEVSEERRAEVMEAYRTVGVEAIDIGKVTDDGQVCGGVHPFCLLPYMFMVAYFYF